MLPISRVAKRLGLCTTALKKRCAATPAAPTTEAFPTALSFVEVTATSSWLTTSAEVDLQRADGARMRILYHASPPPLVALVQTFLETP